MMIVTIIIIIIIIILLFLLLLNIYISLARSLVRSLVFLVKSSRKTQNLKDPFLHNNSTVLSVLTYY